VSTHQVASLHLPMALDVIFLLLDTFDSMLEVILDIIHDVSQTFFLLLGSFLLLHDPDLNIINDVEVLAF